MDFTLSIYSSYWKKVTLVTTMPDYFMYKNPLTINVKAVAAVLTALVGKNIAV